MVLTLVRAGDQKDFDRDNLIAGLKPVLDGLGLTVTASTRAPA